MNSPYAEAYLQMNNPVVARSYYIEHNGQFRSNYTLTSEHQKIICILIMIALGMYVVGFAIIMIRQVIRDTEQRESDSCDCVKYNGEHCSDKCVNDCLEEITDEVLKEINLPVLSARKQQQPIEISVNIDGTFCKENRPCTSKERTEDSRSTLDRSSNVEFSKKCNSDDKDYKYSNLQYSNMNPTNKLNNNFNLIRSADQLAEFQNLPSNIRCNLPNMNSLIDKMHCSSNCDKSSGNLICNSLSSSSYPTLPTDELNNLSNSSINVLINSLPNSIQNNLTKSLSNNLVNSRSNSNSLNNQTSNLKNSSSIKEPLDFKQTEIHTNTDKTRLFNKVKSLVLDYPKQFQPIEHL